METAAHVAVSKSWAERSSGADRPWITTDENEPINLKYTDSTEPINLEDAVQHELGEHNGTGTIESLQDTARASTTLLGKLVNHMVENNLISFVDMNEMVFGYQRTEKVVTKKELFKK